MRLEVNECTYHLTVHRQERDKPAVILLHGFMGSGQVFDHLADQLGTWCNPVTVDLIGHGKTDKPSRLRRFTIAEQVNDLNEIIAALEFETNFLHGYSMGGRLALQYAVAGGELLSGLILESTNPGIENTSSRVERIQLDEKRARKIENDFDRFLKEWAELPVFKTGITAPDELRDIYAGIQGKQDAAAMARSLRGFGTGQMSSLKNKLPELELPVLLLAGEADEKYCKIMQEMHELIPDSRFEVIADAGHRVHLENPAAFNGRIRDFLAETDSKN